TMPYTGSHQHAVLLTIHLLPYNHTLLSPRPTPPLFFFFNDTATTEIYTLSLHELFRSHCAATAELPMPRKGSSMVSTCDVACNRSEEHTSELQSRSDLVCRLLLEKKKIASSKCTTRSAHEFTTDKYSGLIQLISHPSNN